MPYYVDDENDVDFIEQLTFTTRSIHHLITSYLFVCSSIGKHLFSDQILMRQIDSCPFMVSFIHQGAIRDYPSNQHHILRPSVLSGIHKSYQGKKHIHFHLCFELSMPRSMEHEWN